MAAGISLPLQGIVHSSQCAYRISRGPSYISSRSRIERVGIRSARIYASAHKEKENARVFVLSDLHTDYAENMTWVKCISSTSHQEDILLVAGDVAETYDRFVSTMSHLMNKFKRVFYVPGNHDLWCRKDGENFLDSLDKLNALLHACDEIGVESSPLIVGGVGIIPLFSWYHESFDTEQDITGLRVPSLEMACKDFHACRWSAELRDGGDSLARYFDAMNEKHALAIEEIQRKCDKIITFSHFVPRQDLCPEKRMLFYPNLPKIIGSNFLEARIRSIHGVKGGEASCHVFGHTHFGWDAVLDGIRNYSKFYSPTRRHQTFEALRLVYAFGLFHIFPPVLILESHLMFSFHLAGGSEQQWRPFFEVTDRMHKNEGFCAGFHCEILRCIQECSLHCEILRCIQECSLESNYPIQSLEQLLFELEMQEKPLESASQIKSTKENEEPNMSHNPISTSAMVALLLQ